MLEKQIIKKYWWAIAAGNILAVILGLVSTSLFTLLGPSIQIYMSRDSASEVEIVSLVGAKYFDIIKGFTGLESISIVILLKVIPLVIIFLAIIRTILTVSQWYLWEFVSEQIIKDIRLKLAGLVIHSRQDNKNKSIIDANVSGLISYDCRKTKDYFVRFYGGFPREFSQCIMYGISLYLLSDHLFSIFFLALLPSVLVLGVLGKRIRKKAKSLMTNYSEMSEWLQQRLLGIETIKAFNTEELEVENFHNLSAKNFRSFIRVSSTTAKTSPILEFIAVIAMVSVLYVSLIQVKDGLVSGAVVLSFFSVVASLSQSASKLGKYFNASREGQVALSRIEGLLDFRDEKGVNYKNYSSMNEMIKLSSVSLAFNNQNFFNKLNLNLLKSKSYALVGPSGAGKSTLINLILGIIKPDSGEVLLHNKLNKPGGLVTVPQKLILSPDGILDNVAFPDHVTSSQRAENSLLNLFSKGELTKILSQDSTDVNLSGGQEQRILLSRLFYHSPHFMIVDEGTSALDLNNEDRFYQKLKLKMKEDASSAIFIAHRPKVLDYCDEVIHIENGCIKYQGVVEEYRKSPLYKELFC